MKRAWVQSVLRELRARMLLGYGQKIKKKNLQETGPPHWGSERSTTNADAELTPIPWLNSTWKALKKSRRAEGTIESHKDFVTTVLSGSSPRRKGLQTE